MVATLRPRKSVWLKRSHYHHFFFLLSLSLSPPYYHYYYYFFIFYLSLSFFWFRCVQQSSFWEYVGFPLIETEEGNDGIFFVNVCPSKFRFVRFQFGRFSDRFSISFTNRDAFFLALLLLLLFPFACPLSSTIDYRLIFEMSIGFIYSIFRFFLNFSRLDLATIVFFKNWSAERF